MLEILRPPGIVYESETPEQAAEQDRLIAAHNERVRREREAWMPAPMEALRPWCEKNAPHLLQPGGLEAMRKGKSPNAVGQVR